jgi:hypothetical protein
MVDGKRLWWAMVGSSVAEPEVGELSRELTMYVSRKQRSHATLRLQEMNVKEGVGKKKKPASTAGSRAGYK